MYRIVTFAIAMLLPGMALADYHLKGLGSGFFISDRQILTNAHVIATCTGITVAHQDQDWFSAQVSASDPKADIALLVTAERSSASATFETAIETIDPTNLTIVGFPKLGLPTIRPVRTPATGIVADIATDLGRYLLKGDIRPGDSGSSVIDGRGLIVGMTEAQVDTVDIYKATGRLVVDQGLAISNAAMRRFLDVHSVAYAAKDGRDALTPEALFDTARHFVVQIGCWGP